MKKSHFLGGFFFIFLSLVHTPGIGQTIPKLPIQIAPTMIDCASKSVVKTVPKIVTDRLLQKSLDTMFFFQISGPPVPIKRELFYSKEYSIFRDTAKLVYDPSVNSPVQKVPSQFKVQYEFVANKGDNSQPLDNSIAVSNTNMLISMSNQMVEIYDNTQLKMTKSLASFFFNKINIPCDPKVVFDSETKRFIVFVQRCDGDYQNSEIMIGFSESENPMGDWHMYKLSGNPKEINNHWFDYPKMGVSSDGLYISGNIFNSNDEFQETVVYQIDKKNGYDGNPLNYVVWTNICDAPFTIHPVSYGFKGSYGPGIFMIGTTWSNDPNTIKLYSINGSVYNPNSRLSFYRVTTDSYDFFAQAEQPLGKVIDNGDIRIQDALYDGKRIHYVFTSGNQRKFSRINYNVLEVATLKNKSILLGDETNTSYAYPSLAYFSDKQSDVISFIQYNGSSNLSYPDIKCKTCDSNLKCSPEYTIKKGQSIIDGERWGDYSGASKQHFDITTLWLSSTFGGDNSRKTYLTKIVSVQTPDIETEFDLELLAVKNQLRFYMDHDSEIEILITDSNGFETSYTEKVRQGYNQISMMTSKMESGKYNVAVFSKDELGIKSLNKKMIDKIKFRID